MFVNGAENVECWCLMAFIEIIIENGRFCASLMTLSVQKLVVYYLLIKYA